MPRNIEYFIEKKILTESINETDFIELLLTTSIGSGIYPPHNILKQYGTNYGFDNILEFDTKEALLQRIKNSEEKIIYWKNKLVIEDEAIVKKLVDDFSKKETYWLEQRESIFTKINALKIYIQKTESFSTKTELQKKYKEILLNYINNYQSVLFIKLGKLLENRNTAIEYHDYVNEQITNYENIIKRAENYLNYDESFFNEIINLWFPKKNE